MSLVKPALCLQNPTRLLSLPPFSFVWFSTHKPNKPVCILGIFLSEMDLKINCLIQFLCLGI